MPVILNEQNHQAGDYEHGPPHDIYKAVVFLHLAEDIEEGIGDEDAYRRGPKVDSLNVSDRYSHLRIFLNYKFVKFRDSAIRQPLYILNM